jgi:hypothetical protein
MRVMVLGEDQKRFGSMLWKEGRSPCGSLLRRDMQEEKHL